MKPNQTTIARPRTELFATIALLGIICLSTATAATTIVSESFGGTGADLNGTTAEIFASGITTAGGSSTWSASTSFNDDGSLVSGNNQGAYLNMGTYINDTKGTASGLLTFSVIINSLPDSAWAGFGFFVGNTPSINENFTNALASGSGTIIWRNTDSELDGFAGPGSSNGVDGPNGVTAVPQLLTIVLDLTTHDNTSDFGTVSFFQGDGTGTAFGSHAYTSDISFGSIGLSTAGNNVNSSYSSFELSQVPEPSAALLSGFGAILLLRRRR